MAASMTYNFPQTGQAYHGKAMTTKELANEYGCNNGWLRRKIKQYVTDLGKRHLLLPNEINTVIMNMGDFRNDPLTASHISSKRPKS